MEKRKNSVRMDALKKVLSRIAVYRWWLILSLIMAAAIVGLTLYVPVLTGNAVDLIVGKGRVDFGGLGKILLKIGIAVGATALLQWLMNVINNRITYRTVRDLRADAFRKIESLPLGYLDSHPTGEIVSRVVADVDQVADGLLIGFTQLFTGVITILGTLGFMLAVNPVITLVVVLITPVSLFVAAFIAKHTYDMFRLQSETRGAQTAMIDEMISGQNIVQAFGREEQTLSDFDSVNEDLRKYSLRAIFFSSITNPSTRFVNSLVYAGVGIAGALSAVSGRISVGQLTMFLSYANQYTKPFNEISGVVTELQNALACAARVFDLLEQTSEPAEPGDAQVLKDVRGDVQIKNVDFAYRPDQRLIEGLNLHAAPGQRIAIVGPTGCGKTTIINLLMRFYDVDAGEISVDGIPIRTATQSSLRKGYGMVLQETWLRSGTIRENITMGRPDATEEEIVEAAKACHAHGFIKRLPEGYDTFIEEDGGSLSQGQKQLLSIARVMLCHPPMLILDEATSSIDTRTELRVQEAFQRLMEGHTSFVVAHRLSTIRTADCILVMRDGHIIEQGRHEELLKRNGFYATLYNSQYAAPADSAAG